MKWCHLECLDSAVVLVSCQCVVPFPSDIENLNLSTNPLLPSWNEVAKMARQLPRLVLLNLRSGTQHMKGNVVVLQSTVCIAQHLLSIVLYCGV